MRIYLIAFLLLMGGMHAFGGVLDSLQQVANKEGREAIDAINSMIGEDEISEDGDALLPYIEMALTRAKEEGYKYGLAEAQLDMGLYHLLRSGNLFEAVTLLESALAVYQQENHIGRQLLVNRLIGNAYKDRGDLAQALEFYLTSLRLAEVQNDSIERAFTLGSIGLIYKNQEKYNNALEYFQNALDILLASGNQPASVAITYSNMGVCESGLKNYTGALSYFERALNIDKQEGDKAGIAFDYLSIAEVYDKQDKHRDALLYIEKAWQIFEEMNDRASVMACRILEARIFKEEGLPRKAIEMLATVVDTAKQYGWKPLLKDAYEELYRSHEAIGNTEASYHYYKEFIAIKDSIASAEVSDSIEKLRSAYDAEKRAKEIERLKMEAALQEAKIGKQQQLSFFGSFATLLLVVLLFVIYGRYKIKQKANEDLAQKNHLVEASNEKVMASIRYGRRIQNALLSASEPINKAFPESFVLLKPKDIVSGDFYWYANRGDEQVLAAIDCTGHGVPGAFLTVFGYSLLDKIVNNYGISEPAEALEKLGMEMMKLFQTQEEGQVIQDGMDMAYVKIDRKKRQILFAGANRPMLLQTKEGQQLIKGDRIGLGGTSLIERGKPFNTFVHKYEPGDTIYIFSDGYADQFGGGGPEPKKFMVKRFKELIDSIQHLSMQAQHHALEETLKQWMGDEKQTDDMIVIGLRMVD